MLFECEHDAVGYDCQEDHVLERAPFDGHFGVLADDVVLGEDEERARTLTGQAEKLADSSEEFAHWRVALLVGSIFA